MSHKALMQLKLERNECLAEEQMLIWSQLPSPSSSSLSSPSSSASCQTEESHPLGASEALCFASQSQYSTCNHINHHFHWRWTSRECTPHTTPKPSGTNAGPDTDISAGTDVNVSTDNNIAIQSSARDGPDINSYTMALTEREYYAEPFKITIQALLASPASQASQHARCARTKSADTKRRSTTHHDTNAGKDGAGGNRYNNMSMDLESVDFASSKAFYLQRQQEDRSKNVNVSSVHNKHGGAPSKSSPPLRLQRRFAFSPSMLKSLLQKNVRLSRAMPAVRCALQLIVVSSLTDFLRRLTVIISKSRCSFTFRLMRSLCHFYT